MRSFRWMSGKYQTETSSSPAINRRKIAIRLNFVQMPRSTFIAPQLTKELRPTKADKVLHPLLIEPFPSEQFPILPECQPQKRVGRPIRVCINRVIRSVSPGRVAVDHRRGII